MTERLVTPPIVLEQVNQKLLEWRPPAGKQVLLLSVEPHENLYPTTHRTVTYPEQDIYPQWTIAAHYMHPDDLYIVQAYKPEVPIPDITQFAGLLGGGSGFNVTDGGEWLERFKTILIEATEADIVTLATCFTMQAQMQAFGATVRNIESGRKFGVGLYEKTEAGKKDWLLEGLPKRFYAFRSHGQEVDPATVPSGVEVTAVDAQDGSVAAVRIGDWSAGVQFHTDLSLPIMMGLANSPTRRAHIERNGQEVSDVVRSMWTKQSVVMDTQRIINENFYRRMHIRHRRAVNNTL